VTADCVPCELTIISGQETWRGRQLEAHVDYVVGMQWDPDLQIKATDRLEIVDSLLLPVGHPLNVLYVQPGRVDGRAPRIEVFCRDG
jgi:hypothetical protein